ncbi:GNAT family N-acetyltransferase [Streptomyces sp. NPDC051677]|uniref:GNAT family N-acetyltransferase n=1 Tax=Streptomyces sp. NPDC051677 TaxID=3365669 RepID=UPI0037D7755E
MTTAAVTTILLRHDEAFEFVCDWQAPDAPTEFSSAEWAIAAWEHLPQLGDPAVLLAEDTSGWCALALASHRDDVGEQLTLAGAPLGDEHDIAHSPGADLNQLLPALVGACEHLTDSSRQRVELCALAEDGLLIRELARRPERWRLQREAAPIIHADRVSIAASGHRRRVRQLERVGAVTFGTVEGESLTSDEVEGFVSRRLRSWSERGRIDELPSVEHLPGFPRFMGAAVGSLARRRRAQLRVLEVDGVRAAESLHLGPNHDPLMYMISYAARFAPYSPGRVLFEHTLLGLSDAAPRLSTGRGDEPYKLAAGAGNECVVTARSAVMERG